MFKLEKEMTPLVECWLRRLGFVTKREVQVGIGYVDIVGATFDSPPKTRGRKHQRVVAVELKLKDWAGVIAQAASNSLCELESWIAVPAGSETALMRSRDSHKISLRGLGVLAVATGGVRVVREARRVPVTYARSWQMITQAKLRATELWEQTFPPRRGH